MNYFFYKNIGLDERKLELSDEFCIVWFKPTLKKLMIHSASKLRYFFWYLITLGRFEIIYVKELKTNIICHYSHIFPKTLQFPFMSKDEKHIINCYTNSEYRGKGFFPFVINQASKKYSNKCWIISAEDNLSSQHGILKTGFKMVGRGKKTITKQYIID